MNKFLYAIVIILCMCSYSHAVQDTSNKDENSPHTILIAYFSLSGNTKLIAQDIQQATGGDLFEIRPASAYGPDFDTTLERAREELRTRARPELKERVPDMEKYDVVFLGFPNWVGTMPMAVFSFLEQHDFRGKTIFPFCTHGTSGISRTIEDLKALGLQARIREHIDFYRNDVKDATEPVRNWLRKLGYLN